MGEGRKEGRKEGKKGRMDRRACSSELSVRDITWCESKLDVCTCLGNYYSWLILERTFFVELSLCPKWGGSHHKGTASEG